MLDAVNESTFVFMWLVSDDGHACDPGGPRMLTTWTFNLNRNQKSFQGCNLKRQVRHPRVWSANDTSGKNESLKRGSLVSSISVDTEKAGRRGRGC